MNSQRNNLCSLFDIDLSLLKQNMPEEDWDEECFLYDKWPEMDIVYKHRMHRIDDMPRTVPIDGRYSQLESFYTYDDHYRFNSAYFEKENKNLAILSKIGAYSTVCVESGIIFANLFSFPEEFIKEELLLKIKASFSEKDVVKIDDWEVLRCLFTLGSRNFVSTCVYLTDLKVIIWVKDACAVVYICDKEQENFIRTICTTEGLYLYSKGE